MKYAISLRDPTAETASELRERAAPLESQKAAIGLDAAAVYVPHPLQNKTTAELHQWANAAVDKILQAIAHDTGRTQ